MPLVESMLLSLLLTPVEIGPSNASQISQKSIRDNNKGQPVARHFNKPDHSNSELECVILNGDFLTMQTD